jgi:hypothetical protein
LVAAEQVKAVDNEPFLSEKVGCDLRESPGLLAENVFQPFLSEKVGCDGRTMQKDNAVALSTVPF